VETINGRDSRKRLVVNSTIAATAARSTIYPPETAWNLKCSLRINER
jgi:hypothetical protein